MWNSQKAFPGGSTVSLGILMASVPFYVFLCLPAIRRRGFPEIDPFWLAMPWLWVVPIILSAPFGARTKLRKWSLIFYVLITAFIFAGTFVAFVPHHVTTPDMVSGLIFP